MLLLSSRVAPIPSAQCDKWLPSVKYIYIFTENHNTSHFWGCPENSVRCAGQLSPRCEWVRILLCVWKEAAVTLEELSDVSRRWHEVLLCAGLLLTLPEPGTSNLSWTPFNTIIKDSLSRPPSAVLVVFAWGVTPTAGDCAEYLILMCQRTNRNCFVNTFWGGGDISSWGPH